MNLKNKKILITAGGTREYIDGVRVVTNISSGALGAKMAEGFYREGCKVQYLHAKQSIMPRLEEGISETATFGAHQVVTVDDLLKSMEAIIKAFNIDIVIHSAAVSDFTFKRDGHIKLSSGDLDAFVEYIRKTITPTPKIIQKIKVWKPDIFLVGFKFTDGKTPSELISIAKESAAKSNCDLVIANDKKQMEDAGKHTAYIIKGDTTDTEVPEISVGKDKIVSDLIKYLKSIPE